MGQVCLLDSDRLSALLRDALAWSDNVSSLMVSATNGSILAYAYRENKTPSIKAMRTQSTTMTAAYTVASEDSLVFEAQNTGAISVISPIGDHVLLAVTGPEPANRRRNNDKNDNKKKRQAGSGSGSGLLGGIGNGGAQSARTRGFGTGADGNGVNGFRNGHHEDDQGRRNGEDGHEELDYADDDDDDDEDEDEQDQRKAECNNNAHEDESHRQIRTDLEIVSEELASVLRAELAAMKWPDDI